jgi:hypothetical protein
MVTSRWHGRGNAGVQYGGKPIAHWFSLGSASDQELAMEGPVSSELIGRIHSWNGVGFIGEQSVVNIVILLAG